MTHLRSETAISQSSTHLLTLHLLIACLWLPQPALALDSLAEAYLDQGKVAYDKGKYWDAHKLFLKALEQAENIYGDKLYLAAVYTNLGNTYKQLHKLYQYKNTTYPFDQEPKPEGCDATTVLGLAACYLKESLRLKEEVHGTYSIWVARNLEDLANVYREDDKPVEAEALIRKAIKIREAKQGKGHCDSASDYFALGELFIVTKSFDSAEPALNTAIRIWTNCYGANHPTVGECHERLAKIYYQQNKLDQAIKEYDKGVAILSKKLPKYQKHLDEMKRELYQIAMDSYTQAYDKVQKAKSADPYDQKAAVASLRELAKAAKRIGKQEDMDYATNLANKLSPPKEKAHNSSKRRSRKRSKR
jgi:tetratricopeptide (TPR) repeat protein